jgi:hypothetical protein
MSSERLLLSWFYFTVMIIVLTVLGIVIHSCLLGCALSLVVPISRLYEGDSPTR